MWFGGRAQLPGLDVRKKQHGLLHTCLSHKSCEIVGGWDGKRRSKYWMSQVLSEWRHSEGLSTILLDRCCHSVGLYAVEGPGTRLANRLEMWQKVQTEFCPRYWKI